MNWTIRFYSSTLEEDILGLPAGFLARFLRYAELLKAGEGISRVFYCTLVGRRIVMLHQFTKHSEKTPRKELEIARRRMEEVKDE